MCGYTITDMAMRNNTAYPAPLVYANLRKMMATREVRADEEPITDQALTEIMNTVEYHMWYGRRPQSAARQQCTLCIVLIAQDSEFATAVGRFKVMCGGIRLPEGNLNILFCAQDAATPHISKEIDRMRASGLGDPAGKHVPANKLRIEYFVHKDFALDKTDYCMVSPCTILTPAQIIAFRDKYHIHLDTLPVLLDTDPQAVWHGVVPGQYVEFLRLSEISGENVIVKRCMVRG